MNRNQKSEIRNQKSVSHSGLVFKYFKFPTSGLRHQNSEKGQTLVELTIAVAMLAIAVVGAGRLINATARATNEAGRRTQATALATREVEALRNLRDTSARDGDPWGAIPALVSTSEGECANFVMEKLDNDSWRASEVSAPQAYDVGAAIANEDSTYYTNFSRLITMCATREYNVTSGIYFNSTDVRNIKAVVSWQESNGPTREVTFNTVLTAWEQD